MARRPNILLILADDLGIGDLSAVNGGLSSTPVIDGLLREGTVLTRSLAASPVCSPSRAGLLTGRDPLRTGVVDTLEWWGLERLDPRERTLADHLRHAGYATGLVGKWHLGSFAPELHPLRRGFDETVCFRGGMHDYWQWRVEWGETPRRSDGRYLTDLWAEESVAFIERHAGHPWFLHLAFNAPHTPLQVPDEELAPFLGRAGVPTTAVATLYAMVARMDRAIGHVLDALRRMGLDEDTIVVFASDNGPDMSGEGDEALRRFNAGWNGAKGDVLEGGIRVPTAIRWPAGLPGGDRQVHEAVHFTDWVPTLLALAGVPLAPGGPPLDGVDRSDVLRGEAPGRVRPGPACWQWSRYHPLADSNAAILDGEWKLVRPWRDGAGTVVDGDWLMVSMYGPEHFLHHGILPGEPPRMPLGPVPPAQLFHLGEDPGERQDRAADEPERVIRMGAALDAWFAGADAERRSGTLRADV